MKIHELRFMNLNSLVGEWSIDFSHPAYLANGIFAITGPTGAGKTTILDAICLSLYGRTPRLNRVNKSGNEIMSRQTGQCYAELSFATGEGEFRCHWSQQRARKKPDGELQLPKHEISDLNNGQVLETKIREVAILVEKITGMSFEQFTRSMLLAQGGFAAFLQAPPDERAPILEQITGTEVYSEISIKVHLRRGEEKARLDMLQAEIAGIKILDGQEEEDLKNKLRAAGELEKQEKAKLNTLREAANWLDQLAVLEREVGALEKQWQDNIAAEEAFAPEKLRLELARQAMLLDVDYARLSALREQQNSDLSELAKIKEEFPVQNEISEQAARLFRQAGGQLEKLRNVRKEQEQIIKKVRELDMLFKQSQEQVLMSRLKLGEGEEECSALKVKISEGVDQQQKIQNSLNDIELYIRENSPDAGLVSKFSGIAKSFDRLGDSSVLLDKKQSEWKQSTDSQYTWIEHIDLKSAAYQEKCAHLEHLETTLKTLRDELQILLQERELNDWQEELSALYKQKDIYGELEQSSSNMQQARANIKKQQESRRALQAKQEFLNAEISVLEGKVDTGEHDLKQIEIQVAMLSRIRDLEAERARLEDGKACPLCGATKHPFAHANLPRMDETELERDRVRAFLKKLSHELHDASLKKVKLEKDIEFNEAALNEQKLLLEAESKHLQQILLESGLEAGIQDNFHDRLNDLEEVIEKYTITLNQVAAGQNHERQLVRQYDEGKLAMMKAHNEQQQAIAGQEQASREASRLQNEYENLQVQLDIIKQETLREIAEYGISQLAIEEAPEILEKLRVRREAWITRQDTRQNLEQEIAKLQTETAKAETLLETRQVQLQQERESLEEHEKLAQKLQTVRFELYGEKNPVVEEQHLESELAAAEAGMEKARNNFNLAQRDLERLEAQAQSLGGRIQSRVLEIQNSLVHFERHLTELGFEHETDYLQSILSVAEQEALLQKAEKLRDQKMELQTRLLDKKDALRLEREKTLTIQPREALEEQTGIVEQALKALQDGIGADKHLLQSSEQNRLQLQEQMQKIEAQKAEYRRWEILHSLIGSADGKKYRNFAQGLTFDIMIAHANRQLKKMSDRYILFRNSEHVLELNVIDNYQAGEIRSTANLSGGESFLVSLALALGLSNMASQRVRVDSLFLDEGFGSLDEAALDIALDTLAGLQQQGKLIGVISHVPAIKERIATQIQVINKSGGRSVIQGPGCQRLRTAK